MGQRACPHAAIGQIEASKGSSVPKLVVTILEGLSAIGMTKLKPAAFLLNKIAEQRESNTQYLLDVVILHVRRLEEQLTVLYQQHQDLVESELPKLQLRLSQGLSRRVLRSA